MFAFERFLKWIPKSGFSVLLFLSSSKWFFLICALDDWSSQKNNFSQTTDIFQVLKNFGFIEWLNIKSTVKWSYILVRENHDTVAMISQKSFRKAQKQVFGPLTYQCDITFDWLNTVLQITEERRDHQLVYHNLFFLSDSFFVEIYSAMCMYKMEGSVLAK